MSAPSVPPDNSLAVEQSRQQAAQQAQAAQDAKDLQAKQELATLRGNSATAGGASARSFFQQQGLDPSPYSGDIDSKIASTLAGISPTDPNPGAAFNNIGQQIWDQETLAGQNKANRGLDTLFPPNFAEMRVPQTITDPTVSGIDAEQRANADAIIQNMLKRGVITPSGQSAAEAELTRQDPGVQARLKEIGVGSVASEQQSLNDIANKARTTASTLKLGTPFDPTSFGSQADSNFTNFINNLGTSIRGKVGPANLFNTTGLAAIAGAGQGPQNVPFDPTAQAGVIDPNKQSQTPSTSTSAVF